MTTDAEFSERLKQQILKAYGIDEDMMPLDDSMSPEDREEWGAYMRYLDLLDRVDRVSRENVMAVVRGAPAYLTERLPPRCAPPGRVRRFVHWCTPWRRRPAAVRGIEGLRFEWSAGEEDV